MGSEKVSPVFISSEAAAEVFDWKSAITALQQVYSNPHEEAATPARSIASSGKSWLRTLPAVPPGGRYFGAKLMGMASEASEPGVQYVIVLYDRETSRIAAFVDAEKVTGYRTAATSAAALDKMAPAQTARLAVLGSGLEAQMHTRAFAAVRDFDEIVVFSPTPASRERFANTIGGELGVNTTPAASAEEAVTGADVVLAAARSHGEKPILFGNWIKPGAVTVSIGSTVPQQREIDVSVAEQSDIIVCDMVHEVVSETGDMIAAAAAGVNVEDKCFSLNDLLSGALEESLAVAHYPMFKSVGGGLQDVVVAGMILDRALEKGCATELPIVFDTKYV
ncbi:ornithine cyclodeaminase family protein [Emcibacter sp.]|uniref:ornithine cyclodeaminase family protein n=1 Tax=Emcibacter sp. TaxID=1979954 RepID=UPI002AA776A3|nr:ornithine cyclodeaminase family protein [Emcibacter sp.]